MSRLVALLLVCLSFADKPVAEPEIAEEFKNLDTDSNNILSRDEFLKRYPAAKQTEARNAFYAFDENSDEKLSLDEFMKQGKDVKISSRNEFRRRDLNDDGKLSHEEYFRPSVGSKWEQAAKDEAVRYDFNQDGFLSLMEFSWTPAGPLDQSLFAELDADNDETLTRAEFAKRYPTDKQAEVRNLFYAFDANSDEKLSLEEFSRQGKDVKISTLNEYRRRDLNNDGRLSREEYFHPFVGGKWEKSAKEESVRSDLDQDGFLTLLEFITTPLGNLDETVFALLDSDKDATLDRAEFLQRFLPNARPFGAIEFHRHDLDGSDRVTFEEWSHPAKERRAPPDPVVERVEGLMEKLHALFVQKDVDRDGQLSQKEWSEPELRKLLVGWNSIPFAYCDGDSNGSVSEDEVRLLLDVAFGLRRKDGQELRDAKGLVVNWGTFKNLDTNADDSLSESEFVKPHLSKELFAQVDQDKDGRVTFSEFAGSPAFKVDVLWDFNRIDADLDGLITEQELQASAHPWQVNLALRLVPAFDLDDDHNLSLSEFRRTPFANPLAEWYALPRDLDNDGRLSWKEFYAAQEPVLVGLYRDFFDRFDLDHDGFLSHHQPEDIAGFKESPAEHEYPFALEMAKLPPDIGFRMRDKNRDQFLTTAELFSDPRPDPKDSAAVMAYQTRKMRADEAFLAADKNSDRRLDREDYGRYEAHLTGPAAGAAKANHVTPIAVPKAGRFWKWSWDEALAYGLTGLNLVLVVTGGAYWMRKRSNTI